MDPVISKYLLKVLISTSECFFKVLDLDAVGFSTVRLQRRVRHKATQSALQGHENYMKRNVIFAFKMHKKQAGRHPEPKH